MDVVENTYPKQAKINNVQRGMFWLSLQKLQKKQDLRLRLIHQLVMLLLLVCKEITSLQDLEF